MTGTTKQKDMVITATKIVWGPPKITPVTYENLVREREATQTTDEFAPYKGITFPEDGLKFTLLTWSRP
jgi:hypothetical protein